MTGPCVECGTMTDVVDGRVLWWDVELDDYDLLCRECDQ